MPGHSLSVVITDCPWEDNSVEREILERGGARVTRAQCSTPEQVAAACAEADALLVGWAPVTAEAIGRLRRCRLLMRYGTGYNNIDAQAAARAGMAVAINTEYCVEEVATHVLALVLALHRQLFPLHDWVRGGQWNPAEVLAPMPALSRQTLGIVGYGRIGRRVAGMVGPLVERVLVHDPLVSPATEASKSVEFVPFERLLAEADYVTIHAPLTVETERLFDAATLAKMKQGAFLINCARGPLVDEAALVEAVRSRHLGGAGLDVFAQEPLPPEHPLRSLPRVIVTPHSAWYSIQADYLLRAIPARNILRFFAGEAIPLVNRPAARPAGEPAT